MPSNREQPSIIEGYLDSMTVVCWANTVAFWENTVLFGHMEKSVVNGQWLLGCFVIDP